MIPLKWQKRRLSRVPWTTRRSNQSILKEINPEYSLERLMLKLKLQYCGHLMWRRVNSLENTLMLEKIEGRRRRGRQRMRWWMASSTRWTWVWANSGRWWRIGKPGVLQSIGSQIIRHNWVTEHHHHLSYQALFQWVSSSHQVAKVQELQLQHQSFQWIFRVGFL